MTTKAIGRLLLYLVAFVCVLLQPTAVSGEPLARSVSASRQFIVYGNDAPLRRSVTDLAERVKANLLALLQVPDQWSVPILVRLDRPQANVPDVPVTKLNFSQTGVGLKIQLDFLFGRDTDPELLERELIRALLLEISYRRLPSLPAGLPYVSAPDWLVEGILAARNQTTSRADALDALALRPARLRDFLMQKPALLDSQSRKLYSAGAWALIQIISQRADGRTQLFRYIADLPNASADPVAEFQAHFPGFGKSADEMEQSWSGLVQRMAGEQQFVLETFSSTVSQLDELRKIKIATDAAGKNPLTLEQTIAATRPKIDVTAAGELAQHFAVLAARAHPLLHSIIIDYQLAAQAAARKKTRGWSKRLFQASTLNDEICARIREVEDFMNWFEATQATSPSGDFQDYLRAAQNDPGAVRRRDALSIYLDAMELQLQ